MTRLQLVRLDSQSLEWTNAIAQPCGMSCMYIADQQGFAKVLRNRLCQPQEHCLWRVLNLLLCFLVLLLIHVYSNISEPPSSLLLWCRSHTQPSPDPWLPALSTLDISPCVDSHSSHMHGPLFLLYSVSLPTQDIPMILSGLRSL